MSRSRRSLLQALVAISVLLGAFAFAQNHAASARPSQPAAASHGLLLILSQDQTSEPSDSIALRTCLASHPPIACLLLTITVKNGGTVTLLTWWASCGDASSPEFDLQKSDGSWEPFPLDPLGGPTVCARSVTDVQKLSPGEADVEHLRLADYNLHLDTAYPSPEDGRIHPRQPGYAFLMATGPHTIRARWGVRGCVASDKLKPGAPLNVFDAQSLCVASTEVQSIFLQSNELNLSVRN